MPRAAKSPTKLAIIKSRDVPTSAVFARSLLRPSVYTQMLSQLSQTEDAVLKKIGDVPAQVQQVKKAAEKLGLELLFARVNGDVFVKVTQLSEAQNRLRLLLREPRTVSELQAKGLELDLKFELANLAEQDLAQLDNKGKWQLTEAGIARLAK
jgi:hypothetical protein